MILLVFGENSVYASYTHVLMASPGKHMNRKVTALRDWLMRDLTVCQQSVGLWGP